jgi:hypothetical protein
MVPESKLEKTEHGLVPRSEGWCVLNMRDAVWGHVDGRGAACDFEGERQFEQLGVNPFVLGPGEPMAMYHWEADQEDFLVVSGAAVLIIEGEERQLQAWDSRALPAAHEARDRRGRKRSVPGDRGRRTRTVNWARLGWLHRRRSREAPWCERRGGHRGSEGRVRPIPAPRGDGVSRRLASRVAADCTVEAWDAGTPSDALYGAYDPHG